MSGERVSNTWVICLKVGNSSALERRMLIPDEYCIASYVVIPFGGLGIAPKARDELAAYQLVGEVTAHQGYDG